MKRYLCQHCVAPQTSKHIPLLCILIQINEGNCTLSHSLPKIANMVQDQKVGKHILLKSGRLINRVSGRNMTNRISWINVGINRIQTGA